MRRDFADRIALANEKFGRESAPPPRLRQQTALLLVLALIVSPRVMAEETMVAAPSANDAADQRDYETLRKLLGLPQPVLKARPAAPSVNEPEPVADEAAPFDERESAIEKPVPAIESAPAVAPARPKAASPKARPLAPKPRPVPKAAEPGLPSAAGADPVLPGQVETSAPTPATLSAPLVDVPAAGTMVSSANVDRWKHLLSPSLQWAISRGVGLDVIDASPAPIEPTRQLATERYSAQVQLSADKRSLQNYVAGIPFPHVAIDDPDLAIKTVFNFEARQVVDDLDLRGSACDTAELTSTGVHVEKHYLSANLRRLFYVSRLYNEPKPTWSTLEGLRYREMVAGLIEPFDLKGAGYTYARYLAPERQDDSWVYYPSSRRVRRLSTAQRSEGLFGTDIDLDSFAGYSGNPAWADWKYLGTKTVLGSLHARNVPGKFLPPPVDFFPDDVWEPREVHIIVGTPKLRGSGFSRRVLYIDKESLLIPYAEIYDLNGRLWKSLVFTWRNDKKASPRAKKAVYDEAKAFHVNFSLFDMQLDHVTRCDSPSRDLPDEEGWYYNFGEAEGVTEEVFSVAAVIGEAR